MPMRDFLRWITFLVATPVVFWSGWPFLAGCARELRERRLGAWTRWSATSMLLAYFASLSQTVRGGPHVWYDAAVMFVLPVARRAHARTTRARTRRVRAWMRWRARGRPLPCANATGAAKPFRSRRCNPATSRAWPRARACPPTARCSMPQAGFDESLLTGESTPVRKHAGDPVFAGTACREVPARVRVAATGAATRLSQLAALVERAQAHRPAICAHGRSRGDGIRRRAARGRDGRVSSPGVPTRRIARSTSCSRCW